MSTSFMIRFFPALLALSVFASLSVPAQAQLARVLGDFRDWSSYAADDGAGTVCFAMSKPKSVDPVPAGYSQAYLYVTNRPAENVVNEFNLVAGFTFQPGTMATLSVGGQDFVLFTQGDAAWLDDPSRSAALAAAIRAGSALSIAGRDATGATVIQNFSLSGATAAQQAIGAEC